MTELEERVLPICKKLWADLHLLCILWSYKDTQDDDTTIEMLDDRLSDKHLQYEVIAGGII